MTTNNKNLGSFPAQVTTQQVATPTPYVLGNQTEWEEVDIVYGGTKTVCLARERFLPRKPNELEEDYLRRLELATFLNYYKSSVQSAVGKIFAKDVIVDDGHALIEQIVQDVDAQGRNLSQFGRELMTTGVNHGISYILVDHTRVEQDYVTLAEKLQGGARPYWVAIAAPRVLDARSDNFNGTQRLSYFRFMEEGMCDTPDGFSQLAFRQVRIFKQVPSGPVEFAVYREREDRNTWDLIDTALLDALDAIPVVPVYVNRSGFFMGTPPLRDLADVNIQHYRLQSDHQSTLRVAGQPVMFTKGLRAEFDDAGNRKELVIDAYTGVTATSKDASMEWVETKGTALNVQVANLERLEAQMERMGVTLCTQTPGVVTATEKAVNASEANSVIKSWALALQDAINGALYFTAQYLGIDVTQQGTAQLNVDYAIDFAESTTFGSVLAMFTTGLVIGDTVIAEAKRRDILDPAADIKAAIEVAPPPPLAPGFPEKKGS